jgi:iron complex outermembrane receptor protein
MRDTRRVGIMAGCALLTALAAAFVAPARAAAQTPAAPQTPPGPDSPLRTTLPTVTVTAQKESDDPQKLPVSVTVVSSDTIEEAGIRSISEAGVYAPNVFFNEFTARKLSNPRFRGIGSSPGNPGITTYIDGVPQLNANSSSIELIGIEQIEFVRGPQSALFGRNALGGVINVTSARPSFQRWTGSLEGPFGNFSERDMRGSASGPLIADTLAVGVGVGYSARDGFTRNDVTGHDLDSRSAVFGRAQLLWKPADRWEARVLLAGERARDGDYALNDLAALRARPFHASRDVEGFTHRDILAPTIQVVHTGTKVDFFTTTGFVKWKTEDFTDLDYTALPLVTRANNEEALQFTEEAHIASSRTAPVALSDRLTLKWQAGVFVFTQDYEQDAVNNYSPFVLSPLVNIPVSQHSPNAALDDRGVGVYGQGTITVSKKLDLVVGARGDREHKEAALNTFFSPVIAPPVTVNAVNGFSDVSPQLAVAYRFVPKATAYATVVRGFKAGGFNAASPQGREAYGEEHSWNYEAGVKTSAFENRLAFSAAAFRIDWQDLQVNVPNPLVPAQFFIGNAAGALSKGFEFELTARPDRGLDLFSGVGFTSAHFSAGSESNGVDVSGKRLANAPSYTADFGVQYSRPLASGLSLMARAEAICYGDYQYDDPNTAGQSAYTLTNLRVGMRGKRAFGEVWVRNAFDTKYVPVAFPYSPALAPSGFIGESGAPRTFGIRAGVTF